MQVYVVILYRYKQKENWPYGHLNNAQWTAQISNISMNNVWPDRWRMSRPILRHISHKLDIYVFILWIIYFQYILGIEFLLVQTVLNFLSTYSFIRMKRTSFMGFSRKTKKKLARFFKITFRYIDVVNSLHKPVL